MQIIKIGATWCSGCVIMKSRWEEINKIRSIKTTYYDFDIHEDMLLEKYGKIDKLPVVIFLDKNNLELDRLIGEPSINEIITLIDKYEDK